MGFLYHARFLPDSSQGLGEGKEGKNRGDFFRPIPNLFALFSPGERFRIGIGIYSPVGPLYTFEEGGPARYQVVQGEQNLAFLGVGVAYRVDPRWGVALEIQGVFSQASQKQAIGLLPGLRSFDGELFLKLTGTPSFRVKGGFFYNPIPYFYIGGVVISGTDLHLKGDLSVNLPPLGIEDTVPVEVKQRYPSEARIAIGYRDGTYRWEGGIQGFRFREYKEQTLDLKRNHIQGIPFEDQHIRKEFRDTLSFQVGGGYRFFPSIEGRVGYLYEPQSASKRQVSIIEYDADHHLFGIGFSYEQTENLLFHFSYNFVYYLPRTVKGADPALAGILPNPPFIYDGRYERTDQVFGLGMEVGF
jgi:long-subunit fatty acid transport protein